MSVKTRTEWREQVVEYGKILRLPMVRNRLDEHVKEALQRETCYEEFLARLLQEECDARNESSRLNRIRWAEFPQKKYLEDLSLTDLPEDARVKLKQLRTLSFIPEGRNVILAGNPGTGKTHMAIGLGLQACMEGYRVWFTTVPLLVNRMKECRSQQTLRNFQNRFEKYDLVIADEMGYISFDREGAELLFTHLSLRAGHKSTIITSNLSFDRWAEVFQDPVMTAAMVDRLTYQSYIVNMNGNSYRMKETKEWMLRQQETVK
jgi:DNA replication protein DnaC